MAFLTAIKMPPPGGGALRSKSARAAVVFAAMALAHPVRAENGAAEYMIKAAYLFKFAPFVAWPASAFASASSPFQLCILGRDRFGATLEEEVSGQRVEEHRVKVRHLDRVDAASGCHILFLGASSNQSAPEALRAVRGSPILTVADNSQEDGAIIKFVVKDNRVRFDIDIAAASVNHVTISSKLLGLATSAKPGGA